MARKLIVEIVGDTAALDRSYARAEKSTKHFGRTIESAGRGGIAASVAFRGLGRSVAFASGAFLGGAGFVAVTEASITAASDLNEEISKTNVVFGRSAGGIEEWAKTAASSFGTSERAALATASSFGALFKPLGITGDVAAKQSKRLTQLGADLASFYNTDVQDALDAIQSGLVGQSRPLRRYGVLLSEARVQTEALAETGKKNVKALTNQDKAYARIAIIFHDTKVAQGDFKRTSGQLANELRTLRANVDDLAGSAGGKLTPALTTAVDAINGLFRKQKVGEGVSIDASAVGRSIGKSISDGIVSLDDYLRAAVDRTDWGAFGRNVGVHISDAIGSAANSIDVEKIVVSIVRLQATVEKAMNQFFQGLALGVLHEVGRVIELAAAEILRGVARVFAPLVSLDKYLPGNPFGGIKATLDAAIADMENAAAKGGQQISRSLLEGTVRGANGGDFTSPRLPTAADRGTDAAGREAQAVPRATITNADIAAANAATQRRNAWFDAMIGRRENRVQDIRSLRGQLSELRAIAALIAARLKVTKDITRRLSLEDELLAVNRDERSILDQMQENTRTLAAQRKELAKQAAERKAAARNARQFRALGLTATGDERVPGVRALSRELAAVQSAVAGTFLDKKNRSVFRHIREVLSGQLGAVGRDVRAKIKTILDQIDDDLKKRGGDTTKFRHVSTDRLIAGLGLSPEQARAVKARLAQVGPGGTIPGVSSQFALAGGPSLTVNGGVHLHGVQDVSALENQLTKRARQRATVRRGVRT